jgi:dihydroorotate dehydrogenase electron transfer subunit
VKLHETEVLSRKRHGDHVLLRYRWDGPAPEPGQFVVVRPSGTQLDPFLPRPFFVHDHEDGVASLLFVVRGRGTALLAGDEGRRLLVSDPLGRGFEVDEGPVALVGGGVWVAPLKLLSRCLSERGVEHDVYLEMADTASPAYAALVSGLYPGATLVRTDGGSGAPRALIENLGDLSRYRAVCASGTAGTLEAVKDACAARRVPARLALRERMACANGSCYGCAVPVWREGERIYARACVEGPVFDAEELAW